MITILDVAKARGAKTDRQTRLGASRNETPKTKAKQPDRRSR